MGKRVNSAMDGFSSLPEPIIHRIMSLLPTKDATRMSILSKTFHYLWRSFPIMDFDCRLFQRSFTLDESYIEPFYDFIVNSLQNRHMMQLKTSLEKLRFYGFPDHDGLVFDSRIGRMINFAIENNVRELELQFQRTAYCLPPAIFSANSIKILTLKEIKSVSHAALILSCPCLESFNLIHCSGFKTVTLASNTKLKALRIKFCSRMDVIHFESPALCLEYFSCCGELHKRVRLKFNINSSTTPNLKHLLLTGLRIPDRLIESQFAEFRYLETLKMAMCYTSKKLVKFHLEYLKTLQVYLIPDSSRNRHFEIDISSVGCTKLKHLEFRLRGKDLPFRWIRNNLSEFRFIETLRLQRCSASKKIEIHFECLKTLMLFWMDVDHVEIQAPSLVSFTFGSSSPSYSTPLPEIDISSTSSTNLKHLRFFGKYIPDIWVKHNFSQFLSLETLELQNCSEMKKIKLHLECLKSLKLESCGELTQVEIEAPNLVSIFYTGTINIIDAPQVVIITSKAKLDVKLKFFYGRLLDDYYYISLRNVIDQFAPHCQTLTLHCFTPLRYGYGKGLIYAAELRKNLVPPLYNLKHLKVGFSKSLSSEFLVELIDSLLWLAPHPNTISIMEGSQVKSLKVHYRYENLKSWRGDFKEVTMENFIDSERAILQDYFSKL